MNTKLIIGLVVVLVVVAGGWYFVNLRGTPTGATEMVYTFTPTTSGDPVTVSFDADAGTARMNGLGYQNLVFVQATSASGARYVNDTEGLVLWNKGNDVTIYRNDEPIFTGATTPSVTSDEGETTPHVDATEDNQDQSATEGTPSTSEIDTQVWVWQETQLNNGEVVRPNRAGAFTLRFNESEGQVNGTTDCNSFFGEYEIGADQSLSFGALGATLMFCDGSQETEFHQMLATVSHFTVTPSGDLVLLLKYDSGSAVFSKQ